MSDEEKIKIYVKDDNGNNAFSLLRPDSKDLVAEFKTKGRDKKHPPYVYIDAIEVIDRIAATMNHEERMAAYARIAKRLGITK